MDPGAAPHIKDIHPLAGREHLQAESAKTCVESAEGGVIPAGHPPVGIRLRMSHGDSL